MAGSPKPAAGSFLKPFRKGLDEKATRAFFRRRRRDDSATELTRHRRCDSFHQPTRNSVGSDPKFYGFVAGILLLCLGMAICSLALEHNSVEHSWEVLMPDKQKDDKKRGNASKNDLKADHQAYPRLVWL